MYLGGNQVNREKDKTRSCYLQRGLFKQATKNKKYKKFRQRDEGR